MGVDARIMIPVGSRIGDVANVIGIAAGLDNELAKLGKDSIHLKVKEIKHEPSSISECAAIRWQDDSGHHYVLFHFQPSESPLHLLLIPRSTPFWICIGKRLVDVFGGYVDYNDCDSTDIDYERQNNDLRLATNGEEWESWQKFMHSFGEITQGELDAAQKHSAY